MIHKEIKIKNKINRNLNAFSIIAAVILFLYSLTLILSLGWALMSSFKNSYEFFLDPFSWPKKFSNGLKNYSSAFSEMYVEVKTATGASRPAYTMELFLNTFLFTIGATFFATITPCITAYAVAKYKFPGRNLIYSVVIIAMVLPIVGSLPSEMQIVRAIGFYDNLIGIWIMKGSFLGLYFLIFYASFKSFSWEFAEAAFIDGASHFKVMMKIMLPLASPTIFAVGILVLIGFWNEYQTQLIYLPSMPSVSYALWQLMQGGGGSSNAGSQETVQMAASMLISLPTVALYIAFKDKLVGNLAVGGIKG